MNSAIPEPHNRTFFVERSLGNVFVANELRVLGASLGFTVATHREHFADDAEDVVWLTASGERGWIILTKDARIRSRELERQALYASGSHAFFLGNQNLPGRSMAEAYARAMPRILRIVLEADAPVWMTVHPDGRLTSLDR